MHRRVGRAHLGEHLFGRHAAVHQPDAARLAVLSFDLLEKWPHGPWDPDFAQGLKVQAVCDAMEKSAASRQWVSVASIEKA